ncbi:SbcCD cleaves DNA hairpin structures. These structures can inhibit DNA replication and are intermediates in certain DNA recombination reactions. The complex acts as a 3'- 5' double strand exonuclease that can open hairpins. It also has a 5' single-strand endonuclease activity [Vibrio sp. B1REV9]|uniref:exonuclease SbcCD subunit D n=1 Tax=Vibrio sp. B1REV9 TaxID=2751179 RepID=UPI001AF5EF51|nr:exonuclease SbcCD subunit D [Vibrio sp. B1REV9]CAE6926806.1 SbcCD cleaves DNA hairpin structures. These structures can inhibit DNA replication and are intermediates in certain DNA recombination reactions. The complex acts as a 3'- 5' double strand exonuclease that can open hairpins. It also has a 5' single-strand endonuclease activity [Vibrio sp. B1REV9]
MKFIHTSDWHLGRQFHNVSLLEDQQAVLEQLIQYIQNNPVDAVIVAGDIYDRSVPPTVAIELLNCVVRRICGELNTPMILISGNHDGAERLGFGSEQMKNAGLHIISNFEDMLNPVVIQTKTAGLVAFYGMPYNDPEQVRFAYKEAVSTHDEAHKLLAGKITEQFQAGQRNVLVSHCFVDGAIESESERPLSIGGSDRVSHEHFLNFDYVALGHLHQPQKKGEEYIRYSGSLMKYSFGEQNQKKGFTLVELDQNGFVSAEHIDLIAPHEMRIIEGELEQVIEQGKTDPKHEDYLLVRLMDKHAILNPMEKLRAVYPNVLHLEKPGMLIGVEQEMAQAKLARSEIDMFRDFFIEAQDSHLSQEQDQAISDIIKQLSQQSQ